MTNNKTKETITTKDANGKEIKLDVRYPSGKIYQKAQLIYAKTWQRLVEKDEIQTKKQIDEMLSKRNIWTQKEEDEKERLQRKIVDLARKLLVGNMTKQEGRKVAVEIHRSRNKLKELLALRTAFDAMSAESLAENTRFDYLVSECTVYNTDGTPFFKDLDDYIDRRSEQAAWDAATKLASMIFDGVDFTEGPDESLIEVKFLKQFNFIDKDGNFINDKGEKVDIDGKALPANPESLNKVDKDGKPVIEFQNFS